MTLTSRTTAGARSTHPLSDAQVRGWVQRYVLASRSNSRADIRPLFASSASYHDELHGLHWAGRGEIMDGLRQRRDWQEGDWHFSWDVLSVANRYAVIAAFVYDGQAGATGNIWTVHFDDAGRCVRMHINGEHPLTLPPATTATPPRTQRGAL